MRSEALRISETSVSTGVEAAERADLTYVHDTERGYGRRRAGKGFVYLDARGKRIGDRNIIARIKALAIPPAWTEVWISPDPAGHIQATGRDERARKQYRYHPAWTAIRDEAKFSSLVEFARALPRLRGRLDADLGRHGLPRERVLAALVRLLDITMIRVGNDVYAEENGSFGLATLRARHLEIAGASLRFSFKGKSGQEWKLKLTDRRIAGIVRVIQELPGQRLFQYLDPDGARHQIRSQDVNDYIREAAGPAFTSKHFRTWGATVTAARALAEVQLPTTKREQAIALNAVINGVAKTLRNTRAVCRRCYIHPAVIEAWEHGRLGEELAVLRGRFPRPLKGLDIGESTVLRWLSRRDPG